MDAPLCGTSNGFGCAYVPKSAVVRVGVDLTEGEWKRKLTAVRVTTV